MKYYEDPHVVPGYISRIADMMEGRREMPLVFYPPRGEEIHLSDLRGCPLKPYWKRTIKLQPDKDKESYLYFLCGRVIERAIAEEHPSGELDGIHFTVDDTAPDGVPTEIKSTRWGSEFFDPPVHQPHWIEQIKGYCKCRGVLTYHLLVLFLHGNVGDFFPWTIKKNGGRKPAEWKNVDLKAWTFEFEQTEIDSFWQETLRRRDILLAAVAAGEPMSDEEVLSRREDWECKYCEYRGPCHLAGVKEE
jgi:hypothetical protein